MYFPVILNKFIVRGNSMAPTFVPGETVLVSAIPYIIRRPRVGDIVVAQIKEKMILKRIKRVSENTVFLVGDNANESTDSKKLGEIYNKDIIGKVVYKG